MYNGFNNETYTVRGIAVFMMLIVQFQFQKNVPATPNSLTVESLPSLHQPQVLGPPYVNPFDATCSKLLLFEKSSAPYWSNPPFLIFDSRALWRSVVSARASECQKLKMVG